MNEEAYVARRGTAWSRLRTLLDKADATPRRLDAAELREFLDLYREASADLATVRTRSANEGLVLFLNDLVGRGYATLYRAPRARPLAALAESIREVARTGRRLAPFALLAATLLFGSAFLAYGLMRSGVIPPETYLSGGMRELADTWASGSFDPSTSGRNVSMTAFYATNNPLVSIMTGAVGAATFGILSAILLYQNGAMAGAIAAVCAERGTTDFFLSSIFPHGVPEISGIILSGAVALRLGWALLAPGVYSRGESLRRIGRDTGIGLVFSVVLMFIAAPIEGFFSFNPVVPGWAKTSFGLVEIAFWTAFWTRVGREPAAVGPTG